MASKILVAGGGGFIGRYIVNELLNLDYQITIVDNLSASESKKLEHENVKFYNIDLRDRAVTIPLFENIDICILLAARCAGIGFFNKHPAEMLDDNVRILSTIFDASIIKKIKKIIYISSSCVFHNAPSNILKEKSLDSCPVPPAGYPFSKIVGEHYCKAFYQQYGLNYTILRPFNVYGPSELPGKKPGDSHVIPDLSAKIIIDQYPLEIFGDGHQIRCFTHVKDIVKGIILSLESSDAVNEDFNLGHPFEISILDMAKKLWKIAKKSEPFNVKSLKPFKQDFQRRAVDITKARKLLGWEPKINLLDEGLTEYFHWLKNYIKNNTILFEI